MADENFLIFEQVIQKHGTMEDDILIRLECEKEISIAFIQPLSVRAFEGLSSGTPYVIIDFIDGTGDAANINKLDTDATYILSFGYGLESARACRLKISKVSFESGASGKSERFSFAVHFIHESYKELIHRKRNRGWSGVKYSQVAEQIATECGLNVLGISETKNVRRDLVQPYWSDLHLLKDMIKKAVPGDSSASGHYEFAVDLDGNFFFMCLSDLMDKAHEDRTDRPASENRDGIPLFKLEGNPLNEEERKRLIDENGFIPQTFQGYSIDEDYVDSLVQGAGGIEDMYYDFNTGTYVRHKTKMSEADLDLLSEWSLVHDDDELDSYRHYRGRDTEAEAEGLNRLSSIVNSMQRMKIQIDGTPYTKIGDIVEVLIPLPPDTYQVPVNELYSGYYIVAEVTHILELYRRTTYRTILTLARQGIDAKDAEGYVRSSRGKKRV